MYHIYTYVYTHTRVCYIHTHMIFFLYSFECGVYICVIVCADVEFLVLAECCESIVCKTTRRIIMTNRSHNAQNDVCVPVSVSVSVSVSLSVSVRVYRSRGT